MNYVQKTLPTKHSNNYHQDDNHNHQEYRKAYPKSAITICKLFIET